MGQCSGEMSGADVIFTVWDPSYNENKICCAFYAKSFPYYAEFRNFFLV